MFSLVCTSPRRTRELFWIKELGTPKPYGFNDQIKGVSTLSSISCKKTNIYSLFNKQPRRKRSHGKRRYNKRAPQPDITMSTLVDLVDMIEKPEGVHKINTKLLSISFPQLCCLQELALESTNFDYSSAEYRHWVSGQNPPGQNPPGQNPPDKIPLDKIPPRTKSPQDKIPLDKIPPVYFIFY